MYVICTSNEAFEDQLTVGERYKVIEARGNSVLICNKADELRWYGVDKFRHGDCVACRAA